MGPGQPSDSSVLFKIAAPVKPEVPIIKEPLKDTTIGLKQTATLSCIIVGVPQPTLRWFKDDVEFVPKRSSYESGTVRLIISSTTEESSGSYNCRADNASGHCETSCQLTIQEVPKIVTENKVKVQRLQKGNQWNFSAKVSGLPRPEIVWTKNGTRIEGDTHYIVDEQIHSSDSSSTSITIISSEKSDTATYALTATNVCGSASHEIKLKITGK